PEPSVKVIGGNTTSSSELPELEILPEDIELSGQPVVNENLTITASVKNTGEVDVTNITVRFMDSLENESLIGERVLASIPSGGEAIAKINWTPQETGTHNLHIVVDPYDLASEQDESNNEASKPIMVSTCPLNTQQRLFQALSSGFAGHGYDFYEKYYNYDDNATHRDPVKSCYTELEDDDIWFNYLSSGPQAQGLYPCSAYLLGPKIGVDTNTWYDGKTPVRGLYYPELELDIIDEWIHNKPFVGENNDLENFLQHLLEVNKCGFESDGVYSQGNISYDEDMNRSMIATMFSGRFASPGGIVEGGDCQAEFNKYYDAETDQFGDDLKDLSCSVDLNMPSKEAGFGKNVSCSFGLIGFDGELEAGAKISPSASGGLRFGLEPQCVGPAGNIRAGINLDAVADGSLCLASKCYDIESSLPIPKLSDVEFVGEAVIPNEDFTSDDSLNSIYPNPGGGYVVYEDMDNLNPVFRVAASEIDVDYEMSINLKELGIPCGSPITPPCNINLYDGSLFHVDPWQHYWGFTEVTVHSPVEIHLYDSLGRHVGLNDSGEIESQVPNSTYFEQNGTKTIRFPTETNKFTLLLKGTDNGNYTLDIYRPVMVETEDGNATIKGINYRIENISTFRGKKDYYNVDFIHIERKINEMVEQGSHIDNAVEKGADLVLGIQNATKSPTSLHSRDVAIYNGEKATFYAKLNSLNRSVSDKTVIFTLDGRTIGSNVTDSGGRATLEYLVPSDAETGVHEIKCLFNGSESYYNSTGISSLHVLNKEPQVSLNVTDYPSGNVVINGSIIDPNVANVTLKIDDRLVSDSVPYLWDTGEYRNGYHRMELIANDSFGKTGKAITYVFVHNPIADAGGPYEGLEGHAILLDGSNSSDPHDEIISWLWDLDEDGTLETNATGEKGKVSHTWGDDYSGNISLQVIDSSGGTGTNSTRVIVKNVAPTAEAGPSQEITAGDTAHFNGSFSDPGWLDEHTFNWSFGDGHTSADLNTTHTYYQKGSYEVNLTVEDDDGGRGEDTTSVMVNPIPANVTIKPEVFNLNSKGNFTAFITLPERYNASKIDSDSILCNDTTAIWVKTMDSDLIIAKFEREELNITTGDVVNLTVEGEVLHNGGYADFEGSDTVDLKGEQERERHRMTWRN
ncbi:MAG: PKD domain-containing protein, partial [Archaeoglobaceae archaeon]